MNASQAKELLVSKAEPSYRDFVNGISGTQFPSLGVRRPIVKEMASSLYDDPEYVLSEVDLDDCAEVTMVYLNVGLNRIKDPIKQIEFMKENAKYAKSWELVDSCPQHMGEVPFEQWKPYFDDFVHSKNEWDRRFAWVYSAKYRTDKKVLSLLDGMKQDKQYYVLMGQAWFLATIAICFPDEVLDLLSQGSIGKKLVYKTVSKMCDSYRIPEKVKRKAKMFRD